MELTRKHWLLALLAGVLLGLLGVLLLMRSEPRPQAQPEPQIIPAATPIPVTETAPPEPTPSPLPTPDPAGEALRVFASQQPGRWSLAWQRLPAGEPILVATDEEPMVSASLIKLYIMGAVYEGLESGARGVASPVTSMPWARSTCLARGMQRLPRQGPMPRRVMCFSSSTEIKRRSPMASSRVARVMSSQWQT